MTAITQLMTQHLVTARPNDKVVDAARAMRDAGVGAVLVVDGDSVCGVFTERDALNRVLADGLDPAATTVARVATDAVVSVRPDSSVRDCATLLTTHNIRHLPVVDGGTPVGIVSARDFFARVAEGLDDWIAQRRYERGLSAGNDPYDHLGGAYGK